MAILETLVIPMAAYAQPTLTLTLEGTDNTIRYTDHLGAVVSQPFTMANMRKLALACWDSGNPNNKNRY